MKKIVEAVEVSGEGLEKLLGEKVLLMCANYFYTGRLIGVNTDCILIEDPALVYETGPWTDGSFKDVQKLYTKQWYIQRAAIESFGLAK